MGAEKEIRGNFLLTYKRSKFSLWYLAGVYLLVLNIHVIQEVNTHLNTILNFNLNTCSKLKEWIMIADGLVVEMVG